jgi:hypothetical protein
MISTGALSSLSSITTVRFLRPRSRSEMYCCDKPERSAGCSCPQRVAAVFVRDVTGECMTLER